MRTARLLASLVLAIGAAGCLSFVEVPVETPIKPKLDASKFSRVYVAGFIAGGSEDVDTNLETVRLLRSQLKQKSTLRVIEADVLPLTDAAVKAAGIEPAAAPGAGTRRWTGRRAQARHPGRTRPGALREGLRRQALLERRRGRVPGRAHRHRVGDLRAAPAVGLRAEGAGSLRLLRPPQRRARAHLHGPQGIHPEAEVRVHRRHVPARRSTRRRSGKKFSTTPSRARRRCRRTSS